MHPLTLPLRIRRITISLSQPLQQRELDGGAGMRLDAVRPKIAEAEQSFLKWEFDEKATPSAVELGRRSA